MAGPVAFESVTPDRCLASVNGNIGWFKRPARAGEFSRKLKPAVLGSGRMVRQLADPTPGRSATATSGSPTSLAGDGPAQVPLRQKHSIWPIRREFPIYDL
jgi:hypothetical protein